MAGDAGERPGGGVGRYDAWRGAMIQIDDWWEMLVVGVRLSV
jgi:hypothetical protein